MSKVIMMCGVCGSGKTTYAKKKEQEGYIRLSVDEEMWKLYGRKGIDYPEEQYEKLSEQVEAALQKKLLSYTRIVELLMAYYRDGHRDARTANAYMNFLWFSLLTCACLPPKESRAALGSLKQKGLFPASRLPECDLTQSYMVSTATLPGKIYDRLYLHLHTPWGYAGIFLIRQLLRLKRAIKG